MENKSLLGYQPDATGAWLFRVKLTSAKDVVLIDK